MRARTIVLLFALAACGSRGAPELTSSAPADAAPADAAQRFRFGPIPGGGFIPPTKNGGAGSGGGGGSGTITSVLPTAGGGLEGGGSAGAVTLGMSTACRPGGVLYYDGTDWVCEQLIEGAGAITAGDLTVATDDHTIGTYAGSACTPGQVETGLNADGSVQCSSSFLGSAAISGASGALLKSNGAGSAVASSISDNGTTISTSEPITASGGIDASGGAATVGKFSVTPISITIAGGTTHNWAPSGIGTATAINVISTTTPATITGIVGGVNGRVLTVCSFGGTQAVTLANNTGSSAGNKFSLLSGPFSLSTTLVPGNGDCVVIQWLSSDSLWHQIGSIDLPGLNVGLGGIIVTGTSTLGAVTSTGITMSGNVAMGGNKVTGIANATTGTDAAAFGQIASALGSSISGATNTILKVTGTGSAGASSATDDGTTFSVGGGKCTIYEATGRLTCASKIDSTGVDLGSVAGFADLMRVGDRHLNWLASTDTMQPSGTSCTALDLWESCQPGSTIAVTTSTAVLTPKGTTDPVGKVTCTNGGTACSAGGHTLQQIQTSATTGTADVRSTQFTYAVWAMSTSGTPTLQVSGSRDGGSDVWGAVTNCTLNTTTWTRCAVTGTTSAASLTDNSKIIVYNTFLTTNAVYVYGAQLELGALVTPYQTNDAITTGSNKVVWIHDAYFGGTMQDSDTTFNGLSGLWTFGPATFNSSLTIGNDPTDQVTLNGITEFTTTPTFDNGYTTSYSSKHLEFTDEWMGVNASVGIFTQSLGDGGGPITPWYQLAWINTGARVFDVAGVTGRPGIISLDTVSSTTAGAAIVSSPNAVNFGDGNWSDQWVGGMRTLCDGTNTCAVLTGFIDTTSTVNQVDGCFYAIDHGNVLSGNYNPSNVDALECICASNSTRTGYLINNTGNSDESFPLGVGTVGALSYPNTNIYNLKVVMTGTTRAEFFRNGTKVCDINTNIPSGSSRLTGFGWMILKSLGATARNVDADFTQVKADLTSARSP